MMRQPKKQSSELLEAIAFPKTGEVIGGVKVLSANASVNDDTITYEIVLPKGTKSRKVPTILRQFFSTQVLSTAGNQIVKHHDYAVVPKNGNVAVQGSMQIAQVVRMNPSMQEFDEEYSKMEMTKPETYFTKHPTRASTLHSSEPSCFPWYHSWAKTMATVMASTSIIEEPA